MRSSKSRSLDGPSKRKIFVTLGLILLILTSFFGGYFTQFALRGNGEKVVGDIIHIMDQVGYVYDAENDVYVKIEGDKIAKLIAGNFLDGYSTYYTKEEYAEVQKNNKGDYCGFGVSIITDKTKWENSGTNVLYAVALNSPAYKAGMLAGDKIVGVTIEGGAYVDITCGKELNDCLSAIEENTNVTFSIDRGGVTPTQVTCAKEKYVACYVIYEDSEVSAYFSPQPTDKMVTWQDALNVIEVTDKQNPVYTQDIGYIKLTAFEGDAALQFGAAIEYMVSRGRTKLILDLCDNGGGSMTILEDVASYLVYNKDKPNTQIAWATEKLDATDETGYFDGYRSTALFAKINNTKEEIVEISVMANQNTASASECLIGALISYADKEPKEGEEIIPNNGEAFYTNNLIVVDDDGDGQYRTFGKGIMQTTYKLNSGGAIKLTTAKILWPDKETCIHKKGIYPSNTLNGVDTQELALARAIAVLSD